MMLSRVLLPLPEGPTTARDEPVSRARVMPVRTGVVSAVWGDWYCLWISISSSIVGVSGEVLDGCS